MSHVTVSGVWVRREKVSHVTVSGVWGGREKVSHVTVSGGWGLGGVGKRSRRLRFVGFGGGREKV